MKNNLNMWPAKARPSTSVYQGERNANQATPRSELTKVQRRFEQQEAPVSDTDKYFALLPKGCWRLTDIANSYILYLFDKAEGHENRTLVKMFVAKKTGECARLAVEFIEKMKGGDQ